MNGINAQMALDWGCLHLGFSDSKVLQKRYAFSRPGLEFLIRVLSLGLAICGSILSPLLGGPAATRADTAALTSHCNNHPLCHLQADSQ